jgi:large subunit ribosomal protein L6
MSRIGRKPVPIPNGVNVNLGDKNVLKVKGPKGELLREFYPDINIEIKEGKIFIERTSDRPFFRAIHGTTRALINNMILGVTEGFSKKLIINEKTYKANVSGSNLEIYIGYSHPVVLEIPKGLAVVVENQLITINGIDKELVGAFAQKVRHLRKVDPYKVKGIIYEGERIRRKAGKTVATGAK